MVKTNIDLRVGRVIKIFAVMNFKGWAVFSVVANNKNFFTKSPVRCLFYSETGVVCFWYYSSDPSKVKLLERNKKILDIKVLANS